MNINTYTHVGNKVYADNPARSFILFQAKNSAVSIATGDNPDADSFFTIAANQRSQAFDYGSISGRMHVQGDCAILTNVPLVEFVAPEKESLVTSFTLTADTPAITVGNSGQATVSAITPSDADNAAHIVYESSDKSVLKVDYKTGAYDAVGEGTASVIAWMDSVSQSAEVVVSAAA